MPSTASAYKVLTQPPASLTCTGYLCAICAFWSLGLFSEVDNAWKLAFSGDRIEPMLSGTKDVWKAVASLMSSSSDIKKIISWRQLQVSKSYTNCVEGLHALMPRNPAERLLSLQDWIKTDRIWEAFQSQWTHKIYQNITKWLRPCFVSNLCMGFEQSEL